MVLRLVSEENFVFVGHGRIYSMLVLLTPNGMHLSQREKGVLAQELMGLDDRAVN